MNRLKHVSKAVHHRLRKAYYCKLGTLGLKPAAVLGIEQKVLLLLCSHPDIDLAELLAHLQSLQGQARAAVTASTETENEYLRVRAELGTPNVSDAFYR